MIFIPGMSSPFYLGSYWNQIPEVLREHGYDVIDFGSKLTLQAQFRELYEFLRLAERAQMRLHLASDSTNLHLLSLICRLQSSAIESINVFVPTSFALSDLDPKIQVHKISAQTSKVAGLRYWLFFLHNCFSIWFRGLQSPAHAEVLGLNPSPEHQQQFLKWAKMLAEQELKC